MSDSSNKLAIDVEAIPFQQIPNWLLDETISAQAIRLYAVLRRNGHNKRHTSFYSRKKISEQMQSSAATMDRARIELIEVGAICQIQRKSNSGDFTSNLYHVHTNKQMACSYLHKSDDRYPAGDETLSKYDETGIITGDELTYNHMNLEPTNKVETSEEVSGELSIVNQETHEQSKRLAEYLAELIEANGSKKPKVTPKWVNEIRLMHTRDGRSFEQIEAMVRWCQDDSFWKANILSPTKLRSKFDQMRLSAQRNTNSGAAGFFKIAEMLDSGNELWHE